MSEGLELLQYIFAGLVASWVFYGLTPYREPQPFNRVVRALIYTGVIHLSAEFIVAFADEDGLWARSVAGVDGAKRLTATPMLVWTLSFALGILLALAVNNNFPHKWLVRFPPQGKWTKCLWKITRQSTQENNMSYAMAKRQGEYVVLVLKNGRRIYGWPESWPDHPDEDFFFLTNYKWLPGPNDDPDVVAEANQKIHPKGAVLVAAKDADVIEFVPNVGNNTDKENTQ